MTIELLKIDYYHYAKMTVTVVILATVAKRLSSCAQ